MDETAYYFDCFLCYGYNAAIIFNPEHSSNFLYATLQHLHTREQKHANRNVEYSRLKRFVK